MLFLLHLTLLKIRIYRKLQAIFILLYFFNFIYFAWHIWDSWTCKLCTNIVGMVIRNEHLLWRVNVFFVLRNYEIKLIEKMCHFKGNIYANRQQFCIVYMSNCTFQKLIRYSNIWCYFNLFACILISLCHF